MNPLSDEESKVAEHYDGPIFEAELSRLPGGCPIELAITKRWLDRIAKPGDFVVEVGVGGGHYSEHLAQRGCRLHLVDVSERLLGAVVQKLRHASLERQVLAAHHESGLRLGSLHPSSADVVLLLGPLYHLRSADDRRACVEESARVLKLGGVLCAAGINRLSYLRELFRENAGLVSERQRFHEQYLRDGCLDPEHAPPIGYAHMTTVQEFQALFQGLFEESALVGVESFATTWQKIFSSLPTAQRELWLDLIEQTGSTSEGLGQSDHFLFVGRKL